MTAQCQALFDPSSRIVKSAWHVVLVVVVGLCGGLPPRISAAAGDATPGAPPPSATELNNRGVNEAQAGRFEEGILWLRQALVASPGDDTARANLSGVLTDWAHQLNGLGRVDEAVAALQEAVHHDPQNGAALVALGDLLYLRRSQMDAAIQSWRQARGKVPDAVWQAVATRIAQAQQDALIERGFVAHRTAHFDIRLQQASEADVTTLERTLESAYERLAQELGARPPRLTVIIYTDRDLRRASNQRDWALGFYDGRIRMRIDELRQEDLEDLAAHELAHAFLCHVHPGRLPTWVHEGYAQRQERSRPPHPEVARLEEGIRARTLWVPLKWLDRRFEQPSGSEDIARAYVEARVAVNELVERFGFERFQAFLARLSDGLSVAEAYERAFAPSRWSRADHGVFD